MEHECDSYEGESYEREQKFSEMEQRFSSYENEIEDIKFRGSNKEEDNRRNKEDNICKVKKEEDMCKVNFNSAIGNIVMGALEGCEKVPRFAEDIKRCEWYKVDVNNFDDMCNMRNYNKYTMMYYPMINYYPYISRSGHFFVGVKCDEDGEIKYILYAIQGSKDRTDQPYGGRTGFVTWNKCEDKHEDKYLDRYDYKYEDEGNGYWIMFYDFENSRVVIPIK